MIVKMEKKKEKEISTQAEGQSQEKFVSKLKENAKNFNKKEREKMRVNPPGRTSN